MPLLAEDLEPKFHTMQSQALEDLRTMNAGYQSDDERVPFPEDAYN